jgi:hypothetical protein
MANMSRIHMNIFSHHWALAVAACPWLSNLDQHAINNQFDTGKTWAQKAIYQLWDFVHVM